MATIPDDLIARERGLLAQALVAAARDQVPGTARRRQARGLRKVSDVVDRTWASASCFGEVVQWRLESRRT